MDTKKYVGVFPKGITPRAVTANEIVLSHSGLNYRVYPYGDSGFEFMGVSEFKGRFECESMRFGNALVAMEVGWMVRRPNWPEGISLLIEDGQLCTHDSQNGEVSVLAYEPDLFSSNEILAADWEIVQ